MCFPGPVKEPETSFKQNPLSFNEMGLLSSHCAFTVSQTFNLRPSYHADLGRDKLGNLGGCGEEKGSISQEVGMGRGKSLRLLKFAVSSHQNENYYKGEREPSVSQHPHFVSTLEPKSDFMLLFSTK